MCHQVRPPVIPKSVVGRRKTKALRQCAQDQSHGVPRDPNSGHLDPDRRAALFDALLRLPAQVFLTGTDKASFAPLAGHAEALRTTGDGLEPALDFMS